MGKLTHFVAQSVDGFIEGPDGEFDWPIMGPELSAYARSVNDTVGAFLYGRVVFEMMASFWPKAEELSDDEHDLAFAPIWREKPKFVISRTLQDNPGWNSQVLRSVDEFAELKARLDMDLVMFGGHEVAAALTERGLFDEYLISVHPVLLGGGKPVFKSPAQRRGLKLLESGVFDSQVALLRYQRADSDA